MMTFLTISWDHFSWILLKKKPFRVCCWKIFNHVKYFNPTNFLSEILIYFTTFVLFSIQEIWSTKYIVHVLEFIPAMTRTVIMLALFVVFHCIVDFFQIFLPSFIFCCNYHNKIINNQCMQVAFRNDMKCNNLYGVRKTGEVTISETVRTMKKC